MVRTDKLKKKNNNQNKRCIQFEICCFIIGNDWRFEMSFSYLQKLAIFISIFFGKSMRNKLLDNFQSDRLVAIDLILTMAQIYKHRTIVTFIWHSEKLIPASFRDRNHLIQLIIRKQSFKISSGFIFLSPCSTKQRASIFPFLLTSHLH